MSEDVTVKKSLPTHVYQTIPWFAVLLWLTGGVSFYKDGDGFCPLCRAWHPTAWLLLVGLLIPCALMGQPLLKVVPLKLSPFWKKNKEQLQWVTPFTRLDSLKPFEFSKLVD